jgi:hypothetical protein
MCHEKIVGLPILPTILREETDHGAVIEVSLEADMPHILPQSALKSSAAPN